VTGPKRCWRSFEQVVKVDGIMQEVIRDEETKEPFSLTWFPEKICVVVEIIRKEMLLAELSIRCSFGQLRLH